MKIVYNNLVPFKGFVGIYLFGFLFIRSEYRGRVDKFIINHEQIHDIQAKRMFFIFFYLWYMIEYIIRLFMYKFNTHDAYRNISFEREAYSNMYNLDYYYEMKWFSFIKYIHKKNFLR